MAVGEHYQLIPGKAGLDLRQDLQAINFRHCLTQYYHVVFLLTKHLHGLGPAGGTLTVRPRLVRRLFMVSRNP
ncbi:hypothetical protein DFAR_4010004 [Desulfarculales bacterium]